MARSWHGRKSFKPVSVTNAGRTRPSATASTRRDFPSRSRRQTPLSDSSLPLAELSLVPSSRLRLVAESRSVAIRDRSVPHDFRSRVFAAARIACTSLGERPITSRAAGPAMHLPPSKSTTCPDFWGASENSADVVTVAISGANVAEGCDHPASGSKAS